jgi:hypothetical protein
MNKELAIKLVWIVGQMPPLAMKFEISQNWKMHTAHHSITITSTSTSTSTSTALG